MTIFTVTLPLGRPTRLTGALRRLPRTVLTFLPLTRTTADRTRSPRIVFTWIRNERRLTHLPRLQRVNDRMRTVRRLPFLRTRRALTRCVLPNEWLTGLMRSVKEFPFVPLARCV